MAERWKEAPLAKGGARWGAAPLTDALAVEGNPMESQAPAEQPSWKDVGVDAVKSYGTGVLNSAIGVAGLPGDTANIAGQAVGGIGRMLGYDTPQAPEALSPKIRAGVEQAIGPQYESKYTSGDYAQTAGEFTPFGLVGQGGNLLRRFITQAILPALGSETAGQATEGSQYEPYARFAGAIGGGVAPAAMSRAISPLPISAERRAMVDILRQEGVRPTAGQSSGRRGLQYFESELGGGGTARLLDQQADDFTSAILRRTGENANRATTAVMDHAFTRIGQQFNDVASRNVIIVDQQFGRQIGQVANDYAQMVPASLRAPAVQSILTDIVNRVQQTGGTLPGNVYQSFRSRLDKMGRAARTDPQLSEALFGIRNALDDTMERTLTQSGNTADLAAWREARTQYRNLLVVVDAATGAGGEAGLGAISPAKLRQSAVGQNKREYVRGRSDFSELAHAGQSILTPLPNSGTPGRLAARGVPQALGALLGGGGGYAAGAGGSEAMLGMAAGAAAPYVAGRAAMSHYPQAWLANQAVTGGGTITDAMKRAALIQMLMAPQRLIGGQQGSGPPQGGMTSGGIRG